LKRYKAFTLIELLIAFSISTILLGAIYFFYISFVKTGNKTRGMAILNMVVNNKLERISKDLKYAVELTALYPDRISFKRQKLPDGELSVFDLESTKFETIEYSVKKEDGVVNFYRQSGFDSPEKMFNVRQCNSEVFRGYVLMAEREQNSSLKKLPFPSFRTFDTHSQNSTDLARIPIIKISMELQTRVDKIFMVSKVFMPMIYSRLVEPDWNTE